MLRNTVNQLITDFVHQGKYVTALCHGVSVLAWARVDGQSLLAGKQVAPTRQLARVPPQRRQYPAAGPVEHEANGPRSSPPARSAT